MGPSIRVVPFNVLTHDELRPRPVVGHLVEPLDVFRELPHGLDALERVLRRGHDAVGAGVVGAEAQRQAASVAQQLVHGQRHGAPKGEQQPLRDKMWGSDGRDHATTRLGKTVSIL